MHRAPIAAVGQSLLLLLVAAAMRVRAQGSIDGRPACANRVIELTDATWTGRSFNVPAPYPNDWTCFWQIAASNATRVVMLVPQCFATECGWDYVHVHDGANARATKIAAMCGDRSTYAQSVILSSSRYLYVAFASDTSVSNSGFTFDYFDVECPAVCRATNGRCDPHLCRCWRANVTAAIQCEAADSGMTVLLRARAGHIAVVDSASSSLIVHGGFDFPRPAMDDMLLLSPLTKAWSTILPYSSAAPTGRWGHAAAVVNRTMYIYGGSLSSSVESSELWQLSIQSAEWSRMLTTTSTAPPAMTGMTLTAVPESNTLYLYGGYSSLFGYSSKMYAYNLDTMRWSIVNRGGTQPYQLYGHAGVYHAGTRTIYYHGGTRKATNVDGINRDLLLFLVTAQRWDVLVRLPGAFPAIHHAVVPFGNLLLFSGGLATPDSSDSFVPCASGTLRAFNVYCRRWYTINVPDELLPPGMTLRRFSHTMQIMGDSLVFVGGFNGRVISDVVSLPIASLPGLAVANGDTDSCLGTFCSAMPSCDSCLASGSVCSYCPTEGGGAKCVTRGSSGACGAAEVQRCSYAAGCYAPTSCYECAELPAPAGSHGCSWCDNYRVCISTENIGYLNCKTNYTASPCPRDDCQRQTACSECLAPENGSDCEWCSSTNQCDYKGAMSCPGDNKLVVEHDKCLVPCVAFTDASQCYHSHSCLWCASENVCLANDAYLTKFPFGQCFMWSYHDTLLVGTAFTVAIAALDYHDYDVYFSEGTSDVLIQVTPTLSPLSLIITNQANEHTWTGTSPSLAIPAADRFRSAGVHMLRVSNNINQQQSYTVLLKFEPAGSLPTPDPPVVSYEPGFDVLYFVTFFFIFLFIFLVVALVVKKVGDFLRIQRLREEYRKAMRNRVIAPIGAVNLLDPSGKLLPWSHTEQLKPVSLEYARHQGMQVKAATYVCLLPSEIDVEARPIELDKEYPPIVFATAFTREEHLFKPPSGLSDELSQAGASILGLPTGGDGGGTPEAPRGLWRSVRDYLRLREDDEADAAMAEAEEEHAEEIAMEELSRWEGVFESEDDRLL